MSKKLLNNKGESIAETLVALLISVLALTILAVAITSSSKLILQSKEKMNQYYEINETILHGNLPVNGKIKLEENKNGKHMTFRYDVVFQKNDYFEKYPIIIYKSKEED